MSLSTLEVFLIYNLYRAMKMIAIFLSFSPRLPFPHAAIAQHGYYSYSTLCASLLLFNHIYLLSETFQGTRCVSIFTPDACSVNKCVISGIRQIFYQDALMYVKGECVNHMQVSRLKHLNNLPAETEQDDVCSQFMSKQLKGHLGYIFYMKFVSQLSSTCI